MTQARIKEPSTAEAIGEAAEQLNFAPFQLESSADDDYRLPMMAGGGVTPLVVHLGGRSGTPMCSLWGLRNSKRCIRAQIKTLF